MFSAWSCRGFEVLGCFVRVAMSWCLLCLFWSTKFAKGISIDYGFPSASDLDFSLCPAERPTNMSCCARNLCPFGGNHLSWTSFGLRSFAEHLSFGTADFEDERRCLRFALSDHICGRENPFNPLNPDNLRLKKSELGECGSIRISSSMDFSLAGRPNRS